MRPWRADVQLLHSRRSQAVDRPNRRNGKTLAYDKGAPAGLLLNQKATFLVTSGGVYDQGTPGAVMTFVELYGLHPGPVPGGIKKRRCGRGSVCTTEAAGGV